MSDVVKIGIAGLGTIGSGVIKSLLRNKSELEKKFKFQFEILGISASSKDKERSFDVDQFTWFDKPVDLAKDSNIDLVIELIGGDSGVAYDLAFESIKNKKGFITANKALISSHGKELSKLSESSNSFIGYEAAVAGGIPVIKTLRSGVILDKIDGVYGILNGTSNFILSRMSEANKSFEDALLEAQNLGYAEADPSLDINGLDAAHKLSIINSLCFAEFPSLESISIKGIEDILTLDHKYAQEFGYNIKLIASSSNKGGNLRKEVAPTLVKIESSLGTVSNVSNVVCITTEYNGTLVLEGEGAGEGPTSSSVLSDVVDYSMNTRNYLFNKKSSDLSDPIVNKDLIERCYYLRVFLADQKGAMSNLTSILGKNGISIDQVIQRGGVHLKDEKNFTPVIMLTHPVDSDSIDSAFSELIKTDLISMDPIFLPVLKDNL
ncbi:homoserine dehydrogenase [Hyphomicrobiales bacterium]|nr:homoserine dehydrogenase [Hyphomicrobiales bacterium]